MARKTGRRGPSASPPAEEPIDTARADPPVEAESASPPAEETIVDAARTDPQVEAENLQPATLSRCASTAAVVEGLERSQRVSARNLLVYEVISFAIACALIALTVIAAMTHVDMKGTAWGTVAKACLVIATTCLTGAGFTLRGQHTRALSSAELWKGLGAAVRAARTESECSYYTKIVFDHLQNTLRHGDGHDGLRRKRPAAT
jgi:hypothetical protein